MFRRIPAMLMTAVLSALPAMAQTYELPAPNKSGAEQSVLYEWLIGTAFLICCLVVAFKPARRSNLR